MEDVALTPREILQESIDTVKAMREAALGVIADCESGALAGLLGSASMFGSGPSCVLGHVCRRAGSLTLGLVIKDKEKDKDGNDQLFCGVAAVTALTEANDDAPRSTRHTVVVPHLRTWVAQLDKYLTLAKEKHEKMPKGHNRGGSPTLDAS